MINNVSIILQDKNLIHLLYLNKQKCPNFLDRPSAFLDVPPGGWSRRLGQYWTDRSLFAVLERQTSRDLS